MHCVIPANVRRVASIVQSVLQVLRIMKPNKQHFRILDDMSGVLRPGRITLLLGPPGAGKSTLLNALAGRLQDASHLKVPCTQ